MELDLGKLMQQAQQLQGEARRRQEALGLREVEGQAGAGLVTATASGNGQLLRLKLDPKIDPSDSALLLDLIVAAVNAALTKVQEMQRQELSGLAGTLPLGGLFGQGK